MYRQFNIKTKITCKTYKYVKKKYIIYRYTQYAFGVLKYNLIHFLQPGSGQVFIYYFRRCFSKKCPGALKYVSQATVMTHMVKTRCSTKKQPGLDFPQRAYILFEW